MKNERDNKLSIDTYWEYRNMFKLDGWDIEIIEEPSLESDAETKMVYNDYKAIIKIKKELSKEEKEKSLIHELLHLIHRDEMDIALDNIKNEDVKDIYRRFHERSIEKMAKIIYELNR